MYVAFFEEPEGSHASMSTRSESVLSQRQLVPTEGVVDSNTEDACVITFEPFPAGPQFSNWKLDMKKKLARGSGQPRKCYK